MLGDDLFDEPVGVLAGLDKGAILSVIAHAEHQAKHAGFGAREIDVATTQFDDAARVARRMGIDGSPHRGAKPFHSLEHHATQDFLAVRKMLVRCRRTHACAPTGLRKRESVGAVFFNQIPDRLQKGLTQIAVVKFFCFFCQGFNLDPDGFRFIAICLS